MVLLDLEILVLEQGTFVQLPSMTVLGGIAIDIVLARVDEVMAKDIIR